MESTIREYLYFSMRDGTQEDVLGVLATVGLESVVAQLSDGLDTRIAATGWPLSIRETMQLKLAAAIIARPRVLVLGQIFDMMPDEDILASLDRLQRESETTVICFSNRHSDLRFDRFLHLGRDQQRLFDSYAGLCEAAGLAYQALQPVPAASPTASDH